MSGLAMKWVPVPMEEGQILHDLLVVGSVQRFCEDGPCYATVGDRRLGAMSTDTSAREAVEAIARNATHVPLASATPADVGELDPSACANAEPLSRLEQLERENADFRTWGIIEVAIRNPNVAEYMAHWEARTQKAEAENEALRTKLETVEAETRERCAKVADTEVCQIDRYSEPFDEGWSVGAEKIAQLIRNLEPRHD